MVMLFFIVPVVMTFTYQRAQFLGWAAIFLLSFIVILGKFKQIKIPKNNLIYITFVYAYYFIALYIINREIPGTYLIYVLLPFLWFICLYNMQTIISIATIEMLILVFTLMIFLTINIYKIHITASLAIFYGVIYVYYFYLFFKEERRTFTTKLVLVSAMLIIILCGVRSVLLGAFMVSFLLLIPSLTQLSKLRKNVFYILLGGATLIFAAPSIYSKSKINSITQLSKINSSGRFEKWSLLLDNFSNYYIGHGHGSASKILLESSRAFAHPHNDFLRILFEQGLVGLVLFTLVLIGLCSLKIKTKVGREYFVLPRVFVLYSLPILFFDNIYTYFIFGSGLMILLSFLEMKRQKDG